MICLNGELESWLEGIWSNTARTRARWGSHRTYVMVASCIWSLITSSLLQNLLSIRVFDPMASTEAHAPLVSSTHSDDAFSQVFDIGGEESFYAPADDVSALLQSTSPQTMSSTENIPKPPLPCMTYQRFQASTRKPSNLSCLVPKEAVETWDKLFKEGFGADTYVDTDNKSHFPAHSSVLVSSC